MHTNLSSVPAGGPAGSVAVMAPDAPGLVCTVPLCAADKTTRNAVAALLDKAAVSAHQVPVPQP